MENWVIAKAVRPPSLWQTNFKSTVLLVLTSYIQLIAFPFLYVQTMQEWQFCLKAKHLVVRTNIKNYPQQWYQWPWHLARRFFGLSSCLTGWLQYRWWIIFKRNDEFPKWCSLFQCGKPITNQPVFRLLLLTFSWLISRKKKNVLRHSTWLCGLIYKMIPNSEINGHETLHAAFQALSHAWLSEYSIGNEYGLQKTDKFPKRFGLLYWDLLDLANGSCF